MTETDSSQAPQDVLDTDLVTQLQADLALVCERLFVGIGSLQRDARPVPLEDEDVVGGAGAKSGTRSGAAEARSGGVGATQAGGSDVPQPAPDSGAGDSGDIQAVATRMGAELAESLRRLERHIQLLPDVVYDTSKRRGGEGVESAAVRALLEEDRALREKLEEVVRVREGELKELEEKHRRAVEDVLCCSPLDQGS